MKGTTTGTIQYQDSPWTDYDKRFIFVGITAPMAGFVIVREHTIEYDIPSNYDPRPAQIEELRRRLREAAARFEALQTETLARICELQAIEGPSS